MPSEHANLEAAPNPLRSPLICVCSVAMEGELEMLTSHTSAPLVP